MLVLCSLQACFSPMALDRAVIEYDKASADVLSKLLLLNIARSHQHQPMHFTGVSNIAASYNFQFNAGATPVFTGENGSVMTPVFGGTISENPTISIVPIEGEEFSRRMLTPIQENKLTCCYGKVPMSICFCAFWPASYRFTAGVKAVFIETNQTMPQATDCSGKLCCICPQSRIDTSCLSNR